MLLSNDSPESKKKVNTWKYYNHAAISTLPAHQEPDITPVLDGSIWKLVGGKPLLAIWTTDFDCGQKTQWWHCIKDTPLDVMSLSSKKRYEITKGTKHFEAKKINPLEYKEQLYEITVDAYSAWPKVHRPTIDRASFLKSIDAWNAPVVLLGAFLKNTDKLCGYCLLKENSTFVGFNVMRTKPECEKLGVNAAMVAGVCEHYKERLSAGDGFYIDDGARNVLHKTAFQDYLEKGFGFRKAYCRLHICYRKPVGLLVSALMPFRSILYKFDRVGLISKINGILRMEEIYRSQNEAKGD